MRWRGISKEAVIETMNASQTREALGANRFHYFRKVGKKHVRVTWVLEEGKCVIISVVDKIH